jgi:hypothetical protein
MSDIKKRIFTLREAQELLSEVKGITERAVTRIEDLQEQLEGLDSADSRREDLESMTHSVVRSWAHDIESLGCEAKGLWLVDFDSGDGLYYCWQHPEERLAFFHEYDAGFAGRRPLGPMLVN